MSNTRKLRMTRRRAVDFLNEHGWPISNSTMNRKCSPAVNEGPPAAALFNGHYLYEPDDLLQWAEAQCINLKDGQGANDGPPHPSQGGEPRRQRKTNNAT